MWVWNKDKSDLFKTHLFTNLNLIAYNAHII